MLDSDGVVALPSTIVHQQQTLITSLKITAKFDGTVASQVLAQ